MESLGCSTIRFPGRGFDSLRSDARGPFRPIKESNKKPASKFEAGFLVSGTWRHSQSRAAHPWGFGFARGVFCFLTFLEMVGEVLRERHVRTLARRRQKFRAVLARESLRIFWRRIVGAEALCVERDLGWAGGGADGIVEVGLGGFGFAFHFPNARVSDVVGLIGEGRDEGGAEPLDAVVGLGGEVAVV
jgi:hypothetical protein